jgi:hypothetical protein
VNQFVETFPKMQEVLRKLSGPGLSGESQKE